LLYYIVILYVNDNIIPTTIIVTIVLYIIILYNVLNEYHSYHNNKYNIISNNFSSLSLHFINGNSFQRKTWIENGGTVPRGTPPTVCCSGVSWTPVATGCRGRLSRLSHSHHKVPFEAIHYCYGNHRTVSGTSRSPL
jgi:hypothetical protein